MAVMTVWLVDLLDQANVNGWMFATWQAAKHHLGRLPQKNRECTALLDGRRSSKQVIIILLRSRW